MPVQLLGSLPSDSGQTPTSQSLDCVRIPVLPTVVGEKDMESEDEAGRQQFWQVIEGVLGHLNCLGAIPIGKMRPQQPSS